MDSKKLDQLAGDVEAIKKFMIIDLISRGYSQDEMGKLMGVSQATISEMFPGGILKKAKSLTKA
jgi:transcriptional regulator with XRE-family HTH domain